MCNSILCFYECLLLKFQHKQQNMATKQFFKKSNTWEWITIHTKAGITYQRRQRKRVEQNEAAPIENKAERLKEWKNKDSLAGLKDQLAVSIKYNRNYYTPNGDPLYVPSQYKDIVEEIHHSKNNDSTFTNLMTGNKTDLEMAKKKRLFGLIKLKDKLFQQEFEKKKQFFEQSQNDPAIIRRNIVSFLGTIHEGRSSVSDMLYALKYVRGRIDASIDPTLQITYQGKKQEKTLDETIIRLETANKETTKARQNTAIQKLEVVNLDHYEADDFVKQEYLPTPTDHADLVSRVNKKYASLKKS